MEIGVQNTKALLSLCYESLTEINDNTFIASTEGKYGIIDNKDNILFKFQNIPIVKVGSLTALKMPYEYIQIDKNYKITKNEFTNVEACGKATIVRPFGGNYGVLGTDGKYLLPPIYNKIRVNKQRLNLIDLWVSYKGNSFITSIDENATFATKILQIETEDPNVFIVATEFNTIDSGYYKDTKLKYGLMKNNYMVTSENYDNIMLLKQYVPFGIVHTWKNNFAGLIRTNGKIIIPNNRFKQVESIAYNGINLVAEHKNGNTSWGVYKEDKGLIIDTVFTNKTTLQYIPITMMYRNVKGQDDWWILGNDGYVYKEINKAFETYQLNIPNTAIYKINLYGHKYIVDSQLKPIKDVNYSEEHWVKI